MYALISKVITFIYFVAVTIALIIPSVVGYIKGDEIFELIAGSFLIAGIIMCPQVIIMYHLHAAKTKNLTMYFFIVQVILLFMWVFGVYEIHFASKSDPQSGLALFVIPVFQCFVILGAVILHKVVMFFSERG